MSGQVYLGIAEYRKLLADHEAALARAAKAEADLESAISTSWKNLQQECARLTNERDAALARADQAEAQVIALGSERGRRDAEERRRLRVWAASSTGVEE